MAEDFLYSFLTKPSLKEMEENDNTPSNNDFKNESNYELDISNDVLDISSSSSYASRPFMTENSLSSFTDKFQRMESCFDNLHDNSQSCNTSHFYFQKYAYKKNDIDVKERYKEINTESHVFDEQNDSVIHETEQFPDEAGFSGLQNLNQNMCHSNQDFKSEYNLMDNNTNNFNVSNEDVLESQTSIDSQESYIVPDGTEFPKRKTKIPGKPLTRKRQRHEAEWLSEKAKKAKNSGNAGVGKTRAPIVKRKMGLGCVKCRFSCYQKITIEQRQTIFCNFWSLSNHNRQWDYVARYMAIQNLNNNSNSRRSISNKFSLPISCREIKVCRKMFLDTLGISHRWIETIYKKIQTSSERTIESDQRGKHANRPIRIASPVRRSVKQHIESFPVIDSHYCRQTSTKKYLSGNLSITVMYEQYKVLMAEQNLEAASKHFYREFFNKNYNIAFHKPMKDLCDKCAAYEQMPEADKLIYAPEHDVHLTNKRRARELMANDKEDAEQDETVCTACFDVEQTLTTPRTNVSMSYYKRKLNVYNFTIYELDSHQGSCYVWNETVGGKGANEVSSCLLEFLKKKAACGVKDFRFFSDNCGAQNRNKMLFSMYIRAANMLKIKIQHRYLEKGHTFNEGDSMHACIENSCKGKNIFTQMEWCDEMRQAKKYEPFYIVKEVTQNDILNFRPLANDQNWKAIKMMNLREISVLPNENHVFVKYEYDAEAKAVLIPFKKGIGNIYHLIKLYNKKIELDEDKKRDLLYMCTTGVIPVRYHEFYNSLRNKECNG